LPRNGFKAAGESKESKATMKTTKRSRPTGKTPNPAGLEEQIRRRAYGLYVARGREDGHDLDDWLQAEAEVLGTKKTAIVTRRKAATA